MQRLAGHSAAKVPDAAALHRLRCPKKLNVRSAAYFDILPSVWAAFVLSDFLRGGCNDLQEKESGRRTAEI